ncbi:sugar phosphate isomerase/epimerase [Flavobacteriaceae bacterium]|nr:sugar phosphate isomerase/epimerase [Flavobacteriaceae bacterium]
MKNIFTLLAFLCLFNTQAQDQFGGLALYTLRADMGNNPEQTLKDVSDIGYAYVEAAGYQNETFYGMSPQDFKSLLAENNLKGISTHQGGATPENIDQMIADVKAAGFEYFVIPVPPMDMFKFDQETKSMYMEGSAETLASMLDNWGKKCHEAGLKLLYHNHDFEFKADENGIVVIDYLLEHCNSEYVNFQMDLFWVTKAGASPQAYFEKYPGRFKIWHVKDMSKEGLFAPVGQGTIDFGAILKLKKQSGMLYYMVEQDMTFDTPPLEAVKISHEGLKSFGFH